MKKVTLILAVLTLSLSSCIKDKINKEEDNFLKISINGQEFSFDHTKMDPRLVTAEQNGDGREVLSIGTTSAVSAPQPMFWIDLRTELPTGETHPILAALPGDDAHLFYEGKSYKLYNGTVTLEHFDVESFGYSEGSFVVHLVNESNASETIDVSGSFYATAYIQEKSKADTKRKFSYQ